jgi:uncharacterized RDD family membrane protein YckC
MAGEAFEIICNKCGASVPSDHAVCTGCGDVLFTYERSRPAEPAVVAAPWTPAFGGAARMQGQASTTAVVPRLTKEDYRRAARHAKITDSSYAGFWIRVLANFIDGVLLVGLLLLVYRFVGRTEAGVVYLAAVLLYHPVMESSRRQGTVGKRVCSLVVIDIAGNRISFGRALARNFAKVLSAIPLDVGFLMPAWTRRKQALHDLVVSTLVVYR